MDYAKDLRTGKIVAADDASPRSVFACPRPGCAGRVYLPDVRVQRPHFRHYPGEGTPDCDLYFPGSPAGGASTHVAPPDAVEDEKGELGLIVEHDEDRWGLLLRLPEVENDELGLAPLTSLRSGFIEVFTGSERLARVNALVVQPGTGSARVEVPPSLQQYRSEPRGEWPAGILLNRWRKTARAIAAVGCLFRSCGGEWARLRELSSVHWGEELIAVCDSRCPPPQSIIVDTFHQREHAGHRWSMWKVRLPAEDSATADAWVARLGHVVVPKRWSARFASPPGYVAASGEPCFWVGGTAVVEVEATAPHRSTTITLAQGTNALNKTVGVAECVRAYLGISSATTGPTRLLLEDERTPVLELTFAARLDQDSVRQALQRSPRLCIWIGDTCFEAWSGRKHSLRVASEACGDVRIETGLQGTRMTVATWTNGKRKVYRQLAKRDAESNITAALRTASKVEVDAENLGCVEIRLSHSRARADEVAKGANRLAWWAAAAGSVLAQTSQTSAAYVSLPRLPHVLQKRSVDAVGMIQARLNATRRNRTESAT